MRTRRILGWALFVIIACSGSAAYFIKRAFTPPKPYDFVEKHELIEATAKTLAWTKTDVVSLLGKPSHDRLKGDERDLERKPIFGDWGTIDKRCEEMAAYPNGFWDQCCYPVSLEWHWWDTTEIYYFDKKGRLLARRHR